MEAQRREEELKEKKQLEAKKIHALANMAKDFQTACEIRNYIAAVINKGELSETDFQWVEWATRKADWYDPIVAGEDEYLENESILAMMRIKFCSKRGKAV